MASKFEVIKKQQQDVGSYFPKDFKPIDMLYKQTLYGKVNLDGRPIIPKIPTIVPVSTPSSRDSSATALNVMSLAFQDFVLDIEKAVVYNRINKLNTVYYPIIPKKTFQSVFSFSEPQIIRDINTFLFAQHFKSESKRDSVLTLNNFINEFISFSNRITTPITPSGFHLSNKTVYTSGAIIEISDKKYEDYTERNRWFNDPNFTFICNTAKKYSLYIDKNYPWRFVFNFDSPISKKYFEKLGYVDKRDYFDKAYSNLYIEDLIFIQTYFSNLYINFQKRYPIIKEYTTCNNITTITSTNRILKSLNDTIDTLSKVEWIKLYIYLRFKECNVVITQTNFDTIIKDLDNLKDVVDNKILFDYLENTMRKHIKLGGNPNVNSNLNEFSTATLYDIVYKA